MLLRTAECMGTIKGKGEEEGQGSVSFLGYTIKQTNLIDILLRNQSQRNAIENYRYNRSKTVTVKNASNKTLNSAIKKLNLTPARLK